MNIQSILNKVLTKEFFRINAGFFLIVIGVCFGFLSGVEHIALARYFTSSFWNLLIPVTAWLLYTVKINIFNTIALDKKENEFLFALAATPPAFLIPRLMLTTGLQLMPAWLYAFFLLGFAWKAQSLDITLTILGLMTVLNVVISLGLFRSIRFHDPGINVNLLRRIINTAWIRPFFMFFPEWIVKNQPVMVIGTKILACLVIIFVSMLYENNSYDERLLGMGCTLAFALNLIIVFYYHRFEHFSFQVLRSLPIRLITRIMQFSIVFTLLCLPEIGALVKYFPTLPLFYLPVLVLFGISIAWLCYGYLLLRDITLEVFLQAVFVYTFSVIVLILFKLPLSFLVLVQAGIALRMYWKLFYAFEFTAEINSEK